MFAYPWDLPATMMRRWSIARNPAGPKPTATSGSSSFPRNSASAILSIDDAADGRRWSTRSTRRQSGDLLTAIPEDQRRDAAQEQPDARRPADEDRGEGALERPFLHSGSKKNRISPTCATTSTRARRWTSRCTWASTSRITQHAPVHAANDGKVVWAADLGIYGNCIVVDHGYGLQSIYGHMSSIST